MVMPFPTQPQQPLITPLGCFLMPTWDIQHLKRAKPADFTILAETQFPPPIAEALIAPHEIQEPLTQEQFQLVARETLLRAACGTLDKMMRLDHLALPILLRFDLERLEYIWRVRCRGYYAEEFPA
jgi:hypothetical protein